MKGQHVAIAHRKDLLQLGHAEPVEPPFLVRTALNLLRAWSERRQQRRTLARLDERMLKDIGLSRFDVEQELQKPFWQL
ncbi:MAG: DUF1127 domain-containing protein [Alphaproteobacteria bacterium]